jgi:hypothetical protein
MKRPIIPILALLLTSLVSTNAADAPEHGIISVTPAKRLEDAFVTGNPIPPLNLGSDEKKMKVAVNAVNGTIQSLLFKSGDGWVDVPYRTDSEAGPAWLGVDMLPVVPGKPDFHGSKDGIDYSLSYAVKDNALVVTAGLKNGNTNDFSPVRARLVLGVNTEMAKYPDWNDRFFPTLLRCEKTHFWGYLMTPKGKILTVSSPDPIASYAMNYAPDPSSYGNGKHRIYTCSLDLLHALPLPERHPVLTTLKPGEERTWEIILRPVSSLEEIKPILSASLRVPMIDADRYSLQEKEHASVTIYSTGAVKLELKGPDGAITPLQAVSSGDHKQRLDLVHPETPGLYTLTATDAAGHRAEASFSKLQPWSWYMQQARKEATHHRQFASSHCEQWLGLTSGVNAHRHLPDQADDAKIDTRLMEILNCQWDLQKKIPTNIPHHSRYMSNTAQMMGILASRYLADHDVKWLELASGFADYVVACQSPEGFYGKFPGDKQVYTSVFYPAKSMMEVMAAEKIASASDPKWKDAYERHAASVKKAMDHLVRMGDNIDTEGQITYEDGMISCSAAQLGLFALLQSDPVQREKYATAAKGFLEGHKCLEQLLIPDSRMNGATLRFWEAQYDTLLRSSMNMMDSPHGWSGWVIPALWYQYLLTGEESWLQKTMNAMGSCAQLINSKTGELRWGFVPDPYVPVSMLVANSATPNRGKRVDKIIGEQYVPMIASFHYPDKEPVSGNSDLVGWTCCNDVHEVFTAMEEVALTASYLLERENGDLVAWNCSASRSPQGEIIITPTEPVISRVHVNLRHPATVEIHFPGGKTERDPCAAGMKWIGSGRVPEILRGKST